MNRDKLNNAMDSVRDDYLTEAMSQKKRRSFPWLGAAAAMLAVGLLALLLKPAPSVGPVALEDPGTAPVQVPPFIPGEPWIPADPAAPLELEDRLPGNVLLAGLLAAPEYPEMVKHPQDSYTSVELDAWSQSQREQYDQPKGYADSLEAFWISVLPLLLEEGEENAVCSPVNIYSALAMLAECTDGSSRQQILQLLGHDSIEDLRSQAGHVWNAHYRYDGVATSVLGSSLWLDEQFIFNPDTVSTLAKDYYASVFQGDLGSAEMNAALQGWLNDQTGNLLKNYVNEIELEQETAMALATTIFYQAGWTENFSEQGTVTKTFHAPEGDISWAFLTKAIRNGTYYQGADYGAVALSLDDGSKMWLVLPSEGKTPGDILKSGNAATMILQDTNRNTVKAQINLSVPRFDVSAQTELTPTLKKLGITDVFSDSTADFNPILPGRSDIYLGKADHAARVVIDEQGVTGAAYTLLLTYATGLIPEPDRIIEFTLDRPFLFLIESKDGLPTFAGIVNQP